MNELRLYIFEADYISLGTLDREKSIKLMNLLSKNEDFDYFVDSIRRQMNIRFCYKTQRCPGCGACSAYNFDHKLNDEELADLKTKSNREDKECVLCNISLA